MLKANFTPDWAGYGVVNSKSPEGIGTLQSRASGLQSPTRGNFEKHKS